VLTATIEGKLASLQETNKKINIDSTILATQKLVEQVKQAVTQCVTKVGMVQLEVGGLHDKISKSIE